MSESQEDRVDYLESDAPIPGQRYVLLSLVLPESMVQKRELFYMQEFFKKMCETLEIDQSKLDSMTDDFTSFKEMNGPQLDEKFSDSNEHRSSVSGIKIRGTYDTEQECKYRAKNLQRNDPEFNVFIGEVGKWLPISPSVEYHIENQEYLEDQLQDLMANYKQNLKDKDAMYAEQKRDKMKAATRSNNIKISSVETVKEALENLDHADMKEASQAAASSDAGGSSGES